MKNNRLVVFVAIAMACHICQAETRWCALTGKAKSDTLLYPPIARVAHINGTVIGRLIFSTSGKVLGFDVVSGPPMLARAVTDQTRSWTVQTDATGNDPCQTLFVADFGFGDPVPIETVSEADTPAVYRIFIRAQTIVINTTVNYAKQR